VPEDRRLVDSGLQNKTNMNTSIHQLGQPADDRTVASTSFVAAAVVLVTLAFLCPLSQSWMMSVDELYIRIFVEYSQHDGGGDAWTNSAAYVALGLFGLCACMWPGGRQLQVLCSIAMVWTAYLSFSALSCVLNDAPAASLKRYAGDLCGILLAIGLAKRLSLRQFVWVVFLCSFSWVCLGLLAELSHGTFRPWNSAHRFAGVFHPNGMGDACVLAILSAVHLLRHEKRFRVALRAAVALTFLLLVFTRCRTAFACLLLLLAAPWLLRTARRHIFLATVVCVGAAVAGVIVNSTDLVDTANSTIFARQEKDVSLAGRDLIWQELSPYIAERPFIGHGYGFWSTDLDLSEPAQSAHSLYVDSVVHFGIFGTAFYLWGMALAMRRTLLSAQKWPASDFAFVALVLVYLLVRGLTESEIGFTHPTSIFAICGIGFLMYRESYDACALPDPTPHQRLEHLSSRYRLVNGSLRTGEN